jgi:hypothetical protein
VWGRGGVLSVGGVCVGIVGVGSVRARIVGGGGSYVGMERAC